MLMPDQRTEKLFFACRSMKDDSEAGKAEKKIHNREKHIIFHYFKLAENNIARSMLGANGKL